jgi:hypothetical protein
VLLPACAGPTRGIAPPGAEKPSVQQVVDRAVQATLKAHAAKGFGESNLAISLVDLTAPDPERGLERGGFRDDVPIYPASVVKLFYLVAAYRFLEDGNVTASPELDRALRDMIVDSSNDATSHVVDVLTGTTSGPELADAERTEWELRRGAVQRYFAGLGFTGINVVQKTWGEGPFGRERVFYREDFSNRNLLTTSATARLLTEIVQGEAVNAWRSEQMRRDLSASSEDPDAEGLGFTARGLPAGAKLWSKSGWMSRVRHDAAYVELPSGRKFVLVVFTEGEKFAGDRELLPSVVREIIIGMEQLHWVRRLASAGCCSGSAASRRFR